MIFIGNAAIPITLNGYFAPPDLEGALKYFFYWKRAAQSDWSIEGYISAILQEIDKAKPNGYSGEKAFREFRAWAGVNKMRDLLSLARKPSR